jgi:hypothetical protein
MSTTSGARGEIRGGWSRKHAYLLLTGVTLISGIYQAFRFETSPFGDSKISILLWNVGILAVCVGVIEILKRRQDSR